MYIKYLNIEESYEMYNKYEKIIEAGDCYENSLKVAIYGYKFNIDSINKVKIAICYSGANDYLVRHCVIIKDDEVIDVHPFLKHSLENVKTYVKDWNIKYYILKEFSPKEYVKCINLNNNLDLKSFVEKEELDFYNYCSKNKLTINNVDFDRYISELLMKEILNSKLI